VTSQSPSTLRSRYVEQAASDLEENRRVQHELAERIKVLRQEEALLLDILALAERLDPSAESATPPQRAQGGPEFAAPAEKHAPAAKPAPAAKAAPAAKSARAGGTSGGGAGRARRAANQPLLGDLLMQLLGTHQEPRPAKELRNELMAQHPERTPTPQVVRNTLEALVAKGRIRRHKQQRSVMYSLVPSARSAAAAKS
jgi:hypothetical protein